MDSFSWIVFVALGVVWVVAVFVNVWLCLAMIRQRRSNVGSPIVPGGTLAGITAILALPVGNVLQRLLFLPIALLPMLYSLVGFVVNRRNRPPK